MLYCLDRRVVSRHVAGVALFAVLLLAGCEGIDVSLQEPAPVAPVATAEVPDDGSTAESARQDSLDDDPAMKGAGGANAAPVQATEAADRPTPEEAAPIVASRAPLPGITMRPEWLRGMGEEDVVLLFGEPESKETLEGSRLWQYSADDCVLNLFFYMDIDSGDYRALAWEIETGDDDDETKKRCLDRFAHRTGAGKG
ncbi:hypothetical protein OCH7691_02570 [Oceanibacterium hippocampi]|uniref:Uncharacterized protein n=2 Tax=Oceanibacterium hippocampi TaxID=745714 RepID=A0A1Y5TE88_9PROT|nr:hypothetical protein OCH7691_02570 [Oceanibacterium hippocampi]